VSFFIAALSSSDGICQSSLGFDSCLALSNTARSNTPQHHRANREKSSSADSAPSSASASRTYFPAPIAPRPYVTANSVLPLKAGPVVGVKTTWIGKTVLIAFETSVAPLELSSGI
jgi:hypothetical protein